MPLLCGCTSATPEKGFDKGGLTGVGICEQRADREQNFADGERWAPLILQNVQADLAIAVDVAVVDARAEHHLTQATCMPQTQLAPSRCCS